MLHKQEKQNLLATFFKKKCSEGECIHAIFILTFRLPSIVITVSGVFYSRIKADKQINEDLIVFNQGLQQINSST